MRFEDSFRKAVQGVIDQIGEDLATPLTWLRCLLYTSDAADERSSVDLGGRRIIKKKKQNTKKKTNKQHNKKKKKQWNNTTDKSKTHEKERTRRRQ